MIYNFDQFSGIMEKLGITPNQIYIAMFLMEKSIKKKMKLFDKFKEYEGGFDYRDIDILIDKGYLEDFNTTTVKRTGTQDKLDEVNGEKIVISEFKLLEMYMVTPKFTEGIWIDNEEAAKEAYKAYPTWITNDGTTFKAKNVERELFEQQYEKIINGNGILHKRIVEGFLYYRKVLKSKKGKLWGIGLDKALKTRLWEDMEELKELEEEGKDVTENL